MSISKGWQLKCTRLKKLLIKKRELERSTKMCLSISCRSIRMRLVKDSFFNFIISNVKFICFWKFQFYVMRFYEDVRFISVHSFFEWRHRKRANWLAETNRTECGQFASKLYDSHGNVSCIYALHSQCGVGCSVIVVPMCNNKVENCHWQTLELQKRERKMKNTATEGEPSREKNIIFMELQKQHHEHSSKQSIHLYKTTILCHSDKNPNSYINFVYCHH